MRIFTVFRNEGSNMKRWLRGSVVLATAVGAWSCSGDPTDSFRGDTADITATPSSIFLNEGGESKSVIVQAIDDQGNPLAVDFDTSYGAGITVVEDTNFLPTNGSGPILGQKQYIITSSGPASTSLIVSSGDVADTIDVRVTPVAFPGTFSNAAPASNEVVTLTTAGDYILGPDASIIFGGTDSAAILSVAPDGSSLTFIAPPGATGVPEVSGLSLPFFPGLPLTLPATTEITAAPIAPLAGSNAPGTAPAIAYPAAGTRSALFDAGSFASPVCGEGNDGVPCQLYKINVPADGSLDAKLTWSNTADLGLYVLSADGTTDIGPACDGLGNAEDGGHEECALELTAGDYILAVVNFGPFYDPPDPAPAEIRLELTPTAAE